MGLLLDTREGEISRIEKNGKKGIQVLEEGQGRKWRKEELWVKVK